MIMSYRPNYPLVEEESISLAILKVALEKIETRKEIKNQFSKIVKAPSYLRILHSWALK